MDAGLQRRILAAIEADEPAVLVTVTATEGSTPAVLGGRMLLGADGSVSGTVGGGDVEKQALAEARAGAETVRRVRYSVGAPAPGSCPTSMVCGGVVELLFEPLGRAHRLHIAGGGHCAVELSALAARLGFHVTVIDDRAEWAGPDRHPHAARLVVSDYSRTADHIRFGGRSCVVIMTHGHAHDEQVLRQCLRRELAYLGMVGSAAKVGRCFERLLADGFTREELGRVFAPVGFAVGSRTPAEIAVAVAAQLVAVRSGLTAVPFNSNPLLSAPV